MSIQIDRLIRSRRRTLTLLVHPDGSLEVRAPLGISDARIMRFVEDHASWIGKQQVRIRTAAAPPARRFIDGEKFLYLGDEYPLSVTAARRSTLTFKGKAFHLNKSTPAKARLAFINWYRARAREHLGERIAAFSEKYGFEHRQLRISSARTRWGSCSSRGTLSFTYRLIMAPPAIVDYVIVHELVHLRVQNHSRDFWEKVEEILPDFKQRRTWLKKNGKYLTL